MKKKTIRRNVLCMALVLVFGLALLLTGCGNESEAPTTTATEPATTEPATTEPATTEPATTEPATTEPATTEPAPTEPKPTTPKPTTPKPTEPEVTEPSEPAPVYNISQNEAYKIACEYWNYTEGDVAEENGFKLSVAYFGIQQSSDGTYYYMYRLRWQDAESNVNSSLDKVYINANTGECVYSIS